MGPVVPPVVLRVPPHAVMRLIRDCLSSHAGPLSLRSPHSRINRTWDTGQGQDRDRQEHLRQDRRDSRDRQDKAGQCAGITGQDCIASSRTNYLLTYQPAWVNL